MTHKVLKSCRSKMATWHMMYMMYTKLLHCIKKSVGEDLLYIYKTDPSDPHKREYYWMRTLKTIASFGLNNKETY